MVAYIVDMLSTNEYVAQKIAGEITLSPESSKSLKKWRSTFGIRQGELAKRLSLSPSVISDYESGRRNSPGIQFVRRFVENLIEYDRERGGHVISKFIAPSSNEAILDICEFEKSIPCSKIIDAVDGKLICGKERMSRNLRGYTVIDSIKAILNLADRDFKSIYGSSSERALIFTKVKMGRSPLIAIKVTQPKPGMIVLHGLSAEDVDPLAKNIAESEGIPLVVSESKSEKELIENMMGVAL
jgi:putative transcriptional regulator